MQTKYLDETIGNLEFFKAQNELTEIGEEKLDEFKAIKQALSQHDVIKSVCHCGNKSVEEYHPSCSLKCALGYK
jgi:hypothetical protein